MGIFLNDLTKTIFENVPHENICSNILSKISVRNTVKSYVQVNLFSDNLSY